VDVATKEEFGIRDQRTKFVEQLKTVSGALGGHGVSAMRPVAEVFSSVGALKRSPWPQEVSSAPPRTVNAPLVIRLRALRVSPAMMATSVRMTFVSLGSGAYAETTLTLAMTGIYARWKMCASEVCA